MDVMHIEAIASSLENPIAPYQYRMCPMKCAKEKREPKMAQARQSRLFSKIGCTFCVSHVSYASDLSHHIESIELIALIEFVEVIEYIELIGLLGLIVLIGVIESVAILAQGAFFHLLLSLLSFVLASLPSFGACA